ncbi:membrane-bound PQQ-dependent dehydrogenase, glucose/quinate/shikimate family [Acinetobacter qingfengensis]|uniref:Glucose dehydrogenase n=1 Tax=Acinetobacter qingfengensis TaxID=1262585 RepID=A0A1E7REK7_9GAMM|nr:membrane-bound PQQ-dependent dehydrogenase, glucose/quinate/shikimate family [Acinetobacter qingfengensis]KAA8734739.1 membrane-bound PQQ-dependent dehydrogenase, glucose/quinate/shikimate family [Acinetobacter qingfengensis]OEY97657.1 glucose dehydrogenase [Acinetobacter qingfengensis]
MSTEQTPPLEGAGLKIYRYIFVILTFIVSIVLIFQGYRLLSLGGTSFYLIAGIAYILIAIFYAIRKSLGLWISIVIYVATIIWAIAEVHSLDFWPYIPRLVVPTVIFVLSLWASRTFANIAPTKLKIANGVGILGFIACIVALVSAFFPHGKIYNSVELSQDKNLTRPNPENPDNWEYYGRNGNGTRFAPYTDITPENVKDLKVAWVYHTGRDKGVGVDENTPIQIGSTLYSCTPTNIISAIDGDTGKALWKYDPKAKTAEHITCRGVGYYNIALDKNISAEQSALPITKECPERILTSTVDGRLIALNAKTGALCQSFGNNGQVDVLHDMGPTEKGKRYHPTSTPLIAGHVAILGGWVRDIVHGEPSGVVRAYDINTGKLAWAWDVGNPELSGAPQGDKNFTLETPNMWTIPTYDKDLNLVYLPTGNGPPDYWGGDRNSAKEKFGSTIVAVDASTGKTKWTFQTVHHDIWDYDLPSQPVLYDVTNDQGVKIPALIQTTKTGQIFVVDRRNGQPVTKVIEKPAPQNGKAEGEKLAPTQPYSVGMPQIGNETLTEQDMWGISTFDQLSCRITFKDSRYDGLYTPPGETPYIEWPSLLGGFNWGGISVDESTGLMFVNDMRMPLRMSLVRKEDMGKYKISTDEVPGFMGTVRPQMAGAYAGIKIDIMQSKLGIPCQKPPFGTMTAIDLKTKKVVWQVPMGTAEELGPFGIKSHMPMPLGMPTLGGPTSTASGLVFFAGTQDYYLRALDSKTGKEVWKAKLPVGAVAAPLIYKSPKTGKQYVVISAGGASHSKDVGDYVIAYALPDKK